MILAAGVAVLVSLGVALAKGLLPARWARAARGIALWLGLAAGLAVLLVTGEATNIVVLLLGAALVIGLCDATLRLLGVRWALRLVAQAVIIVAAMGWEYLRGDMFALTAAAGALVGLAAFNVVAFASRGAQLSGATRMPTVMAVLGAGYLALISLGLPNPALSMVALVAAGATLPLAVLPADRQADELALGSVLGGLAWAIGICAWLGNASPAMVLAPVVIVGLDVIWTLVRRLVTTEGRSRLSGTNNWWLGLDLWSEPDDDLVAQRFAAVTSVRAACGWLVGSTIVGLGLSLVMWWLQVAWLLAISNLLLLALGWLLLQLAARFSRADLIARLVGLTALAAVVGLAARLTDPRLVVDAVPVVVAGLVWLAAVPRLRAGGAPGGQPDDALPTGDRPVHLAGSA